MPDAMTLDEYIAAAQTLRDQVGGDLKVMTWRANGGVQPAGVPEVAYTKNHVAKTKEGPKTLARAEVFFDGRYNDLEQRGERVVRIK